MVVDQWFGGRALQGQRVVWVRRCYWVMRRPEPCSSRRSRMRRCFRRVLIPCFVGCCRIPGPFAPSMPSTLWVELVWLAAVTSLFGAPIPASEHRSPPWERRARCCFATCSVRLGMLHFSCISVCRPYLGRANVTVFPELSPIPQRGDPRNAGRRGDGTELASGTSCVRRSAGAARDAPACASARSGATRRTHGSASAGGSNRVNYESNTLHFNYDALTYRLNAHPS